MSVVVFLYSKYSSVCMSLLPKMEVSMDFRKICIDHPVVRQLLVKHHEKYNITVVPCILVFFANGVMHNYQGKTAVEWIEKTLQQMKYLASDASPPPRVMIDTDTDTAVAFPSRPEVQAPFRTIMTETERPKPSGPREESLPLSSQGSYVDMKRYMDTTPLDVNVTATKDATPSVIPEIDKEETERESNPYGSETMRGIKNDKQESLMSVAQQLQKQREQEEETRNPNAVQKITK